MLRSSALATVLGLSALVSSRAVAQDAKPVESRVHVAPAVGIHYGSPMRFSLALGALIDLNGRRDDGLIVIAEPGMQGNEVSVGYFRMLGKFGSGWSLRAAGLRTGGEPWNASAHTTYVGLEGQWMIAFGVGGRLGYLRRASKSVSSAKDNLATVGLSIGI